MHFHLGDLAFDAGEPAAAVAHFDACLAVAPGHARARARLSEVRAAAA
ncbi:MAG: tetratricopeptide repeat protein [Vicinamibacterales bacterium]